MLSEKITVIILIISEKMPKIFHFLVCHEMNIAHAFVLKIMQPNVRNNYHFKFDLKII